ncbi:hypothetical protein KR044_010045 [Drosophila immigrans]|nr:hypothetical protein KR044_010045 [Drosophila immigrans]
MTSLTLHLIVITLLAAAAVAATSTAATTATATTAAKGTDKGEREVTPTSTSTPTATRNVGQRGRGAAFATTTTTTTTQAPTLRAPRQRRPPTTLPIDASSARSRGGASSRIVSTTPLPATTQRPQRRRGTATTTTTTRPALQAGGSSSNRGRIRAARQPRDTPTLSVDFAGSANSRRQQSHQSPSSASSNPVASVSASPSASSASFASSSRSALKTPRMIQRLVAGHIHNAQGHSTYEVSAVSTNSSSSSSSSTATTATSTSTSSPQDRRRKASSSYRLARPSLSTSPSPPPYRDDDDDDEALLNEPDDFDNWENGILRLSAGSGKESEAAGAKGKEDGKKTLSDQVRDGKYGLIEKELFRRVPKRPGVLSYARNSEVPLDNERNFGGLNEQDIWLAEDHLLVIKGGSLNEAENEAAGGVNDDGWPAIDDYDAPARQIKLPSNPVVPPPFPVQLEPHGPLQLIRDNQIESLHSPSGNGSVHNGAQHHHNAAHGPGTHSAARTGAFASPKTTDPPPATSYVYPSPYAPWLLYANETLSQPPSEPLPQLRTPLLGPWVINNVSSSLPGNFSDFDEDDPSLYYPPAYSFVYRSNYSNPVPPGPLVPGIVLPPPPDHFSRLEEAKTKIKLASTTTPPTTTSTTTTTTTSTTTTRRPYVPTTSSSSTARPALKYNAIAAPRQPTPPKYVERVPVPVAVPIPIYPVNYQPTTPRSAEREREREAPLSKSNPIYYEYFEAKRQPASHRSNAIDDFLLANKPPKRAHYKSPPSAVNDVAVVSITPKPRVQLHSEYDAALGQFIRSNLIAGTSRFQAPDFDRQPFLPMVNYSADEHDSNAFKAIVYQPPPAQRQRQLRVGKHQQLQLEPAPEAAQQDSYLSDALLLQRQRQLRVGKQQLQLQLPYDAPQVVYSTPLPLPAAYLDNQLQSRPAKYQLRPPAAAPLQYWQRPASPPPPQQQQQQQQQFKRLRHNSAKHPYPPYFVPSYPSGPGPEPLYRLLPVPQHKHWRQGGNSNNNNNNSPKQSQQIQVQPQQPQQYYPDRGVNVGHSLASDILVNYNGNNQFNPQAELVPQAQLGPPPLSYQAQNGGGGASLWSDRPVRQSRAQLPEQV